jgi:hypothetical protein
MVLPAQIGALPLSPESSRLLTDGRPPLLKSLFLGPLVLPLMLAGLLNSAVSKSRRLFLLFGAVLAGLGALGKNLIFYDIVVALLPPLAIFRFPIKAMLPLSLMVSVLAALGVRALASSRERRLVAGLGLVVFLAEAALLLERTSILTPFLDSSAPAAATAALANAGSSLLWSSAVLAVLVVVAAFGRGAPMRFVSLLGIGVTLFINRDTNFTIASAVMRFRPDHVALARDPEPSRLYTFPYLFFPDRLPEVLDPRSTIPPETFIVLIRSALMAPIGGVWKLEYAWDYDQKGLVDQTLSALTQYVNRPQRPPALVRLLQIANVTRVADFYPEGWPGLTLERTISIVGQRPLYLYRVPDALPRAYAVSGVRQQPVGVAATTIADPRFDPRTEVTVTEGMPSKASPSFQGSVRIAERLSDRITLDATLNEPGHIVLLEGFLPGWLATVDGISVPVRRANAFFLAVEAGAGTHRIVFTYRPRSALVGVGLSAFTALGLIAGWASLRSSARGRLSE